MERGLKDAERSGAKVLFRQGTDRVLTLNPASNPQLPSCEQKPRDGEKTVIVVSTMRR